MRYADVKKKIGKTCRRASLCPNVNASVNANATSRSFNAPISANAKANKIE